jgi:ribosomal protein S18 acetylase RimI-like enzyme
VTIKYRTPTVDEAAAVAALLRASFSEAFGHLYSAEDLALHFERGYTEAVLAKDLANPHVLYHVAEDDRILVGLIKVGFAPKLDYDAGGQRIVELDKLYLLQEYKGTGVAQALTDWAVAQAVAAGGDAMLLSVYSDNPRAQRFYQKNGFAWVADTYFMVGNQRDDEYLYLKKLNH